MTEFNHNLGSMMKFSKFVPSVIYILFCNCHLVANQLNNISNKLNTYAKYAQFEESMIIMFAYSGILLFQN